MKKEEMILISIVAIIAVAYLTSFLSGNSVTGQIIGLQKCTDSDGGIKPDVYGTISHGDNNFIFSKDSCFGTNSVKEYHCGIYGNIVSKILPCANGCKDGACINTKPDLIIESITMTESNVGGVASYTFTTYVKNIGSVPAAKSSLRMEFDPSQPQRINVGTPSEYYNMYSSMTAPIPMNDLISGDYLPPGEHERFYEFINPSEEGYVTITVIADTKEEVDETNEQNNKMSETFYVKKVYNLSGCTDSDGGIDYFVKGYAKGGIGGTIGAEDMCSAETGELYEYYCKNNQIEHVTYFCPPNGCQDGACIQSIPDTLVYAKIEGVDNLQISNLADQLALSIEIPLEGRLNIIESPYFTPAQYINPPILTNKAWLTYKDANNLNVYYWDTTTLNETFAGTIRIK